MKKFCLLLAFLFTFCFHFVNATDLNQYRHFITAVHDIDKVINDKPQKVTHIFLNDGTEWVVNSDGKGSPSNSFKEDLEVFIKPLEHKKDVLTDDYEFYFLDKDGNEKKASVYLIPGSAKKYLPVITEFKTVLVKNGWLFNEYNYFVVLSDGSSWKVSDFITDVDEWEIGDAILISAVDSKYEKWIVINADRNEEGIFFGWKRIYETHEHPYFEVEASDVQ